MNTVIKYCPKTLEEFVFATPQLKHQVMRYAQGGSTTPLVLYGKNGTGKSTLAKLIPQAIDGTSVQVNKVMASTLNNEKEVMDKFTRSVAYDKFFVTANQSMNYTVVEEVNFEAKASSALRVALDDMAGRNLFIFTTNEIAKIDKGLASRATLVEVPPIPPEIFIAKAMTILKAEKIELNEADVFDVLDCVYEMHQDNRKYYDALDDLISRVYLEKHSTN